MTVTKEQNGSSLSIAVEGSLDTETAPALEKELKGGLLDGITDLSFDLAGVTYVSSFGLRVLLYAHTAMERRGGRLVVRNVVPEVMDVLDLTGFTAFLNLE